ncbi:MAG: DUF927 domain-containing protein [Acholeplasmataceae bacterium]|nr:DUF927 domain-containing protein [Acholeplasmataceae bacterium]
MSLPETPDNISANVKNLKRYGLDELIQCMPQSTANIAQSVKVSSYEASNPVMTDSIAKHCAFIEHFRDQAKTLGYQAWFAGISNLALCADGEEVIHKWSSPHPNYDYDETQKMIESARASDTPATCAYIRDTVGFSGCCSCPVKSPIAWGSSNLGRSLDVMDNFFKSLESDSNLSLQPIPHRIASALTTIRLMDLCQFEETLGKLKDLRPKLNVAALKANIKKLADEEETRQEEIRTLMRSEELSRQLGYNVKIPSGFSLSDNGIEKMSKDKRTTILQRLVLPYRRYSYPGNELIGLKFQRGQGYSGVIVPRTTLASSSKAIELSAHGIPIDTSTSLSVVPFFTKFLLENEASMPFLKATPHLGWQEDGSFLPGLSSVRLVKTGEETDSTASLEPSGTIEEWVSAMRPLRQYMGSRLAMAASMAGPLLHLIGIRTFIVHLWGPSQGGKTASQKAALSLWINPAPAAGNMVSFNATQVALETTLGYLKNLPFMINERQQVGNEQTFISNLVYMLGEEQGRSRGAKNGGLRKVFTWNTTIITSGEHPLTISSSSGGQQTRSLEIFAENFIADARLASQMHSLSERYYGTAGIKVLEYAMANRGELIGEFEAFKASIMASHPQLLGSYYDYIAILASSEKLLAHILYGHTVEEADTLAQELIAYVVSSLPTNIPEHMQAYTYLQDWVNQHIDQFRADDIPRRSGWIDGNDVYFLPIAFDETLEEGHFHPSRVRRDFAVHNLLIRSANELTVTKVSPLTLRKTRVIHLPNFLPSKDLIQDFND